MGLYQKHRPDTLETFIGNEDMVNGLTNLLDNSDIPHVFLFSGATGCGKTTLARIVSGMVGAEKEDVTEVDTADFRGIDTVRDIRRQSQYMPLAGDSRAWILDECHKLSNDAQNALLKLLEDTPAHVYFFLCTTEPHKLIPTIKGRCSIHEVKPLDELPMVKLLKRISRAEGKKVDKKILIQIAEDSLGHPRNAINILEKVLVVDEDRQMLVAKKAAEEQSESIELCRALLRHASWKEISTILKGVKDKDPEGVRRHVLGYCTTVLLGKRNDIAAAIMEEFIEPFYNTGYAGLVYACYCVINSE